MFFNAALIFFKVYDNVVELLLPVILKKNQISYFNLYATPCVIKKITNVL